MLMLFSCPVWLLILIVVLILLSTLWTCFFYALFYQLVQWCCMKTESGHMDTAEDPYYAEKKQPPQAPLPVYTPQTSVTDKPVSTPVVLVSGAKLQTDRFISCSYICIIFMWRYTVEMCVQTLFEKGLTFSLKTDI